VRGAGSPSGVQLCFRLTTGGIASLNSRLIACTPTGVRHVLATEDIDLSQSGMQGALPNLLHLLTAHVVPDILNAHQALVEGEANW
jgi:hypothetical protein